MALNRGFTVIKAKMRALGLWYAYTAASPLLPDLGAILQSVSEADAG